MELYIYMYIYIRERETFNKYIKVVDFLGASFVAILWLIRFWEFFRPPPRLFQPLLLLLGTKEHLWYSSF